ncbi:histidine kinase dimerization/phospho-acceptor domain-containing protein [Clostridium scatologenes]|uniref:HAMP domain-containing sensor histidine kinase n=1 Tax=Clostridium scatologenes TaxID=1548 RepID=UPI001FA73482|nr:histidine kinase dimerization/phospho-acceptor domain-containing protein [Clostridium scatologenes]
MKLKNKFIYICLCALSIFAAAFSVLSACDIVKNYSYIEHKTYFDTDEFGREVYSYCQNLSNFYVYYKDYNNKFGENKASKEDINGLKLFYEDKLKSAQAEIENKYNNYIQESERVSYKDKLIDEKNKKLEEVRKENTKSDEELKKEVASRYDKDYEAIKKSVQNRNDIKYYIKNTKTNEIYHNLTGQDTIQEYIQKESLFTIEFPLKRAENKKLLNINSIFKSFSWEGYIMIPKQSASNNYIIENYNYYNSVRSRLIKEMLIGVASLITALLILVGIKKDENLKINFTKQIKSSYKKLPMDVNILIFCIYTAIMLGYMLKLSFFYKPLGVKHFIKFTIVSIYVAYVIFSIKVFIKLMKNKKELLNKWNESLSCRLIDVAKRSFIAKDLKLQILLSTIITTILALFTIILVMISHNIMLGAIIGLAYIILILRIMFKKIDYLNEILKGTEEIASGNLNYVIKEKEESHLSKIAHNINNIKSGYKKSLQSQIKSERLKSELITNVSHDLKTPLTSIINYINLLKKEGLSEDEIKGYIGVLDRKSERLKVLIEDLFEASKMSSGSVELNIEKVDVAALLEQSIAELDEKIKKASLTLRVKYSNKHIYANLDGKKTWRVFENLINNIIKYSAPNTRVYINLMEEDNKILIVMKNISSYEMDFDAEEIFERFKRGDKSRNTEGSGLGLAIAKSIVELQGGKLNIEIDGDLFKAIVQFDQAKP